MDIVCDKSTAEEVPLYSPQFLWSGTEWDEPSINAFTERTCDLINAICELAETGSYDPPYSLRYVVVASDFESAVCYWQQQLGEPEGVSADAFGKTFFWNSGSQDSTYSIIVISESIARCFLGGHDVPEQLYVAATNTIAHELGHIIWDQIALAAFGEQKLPTPGLPTWRRLIAKSALSEAFASMIASRHTPERDLHDDDGTQLAKDILNEALNKIALAEEECGVNDFLSRLITELADVFSQFGRSIGCDTDAGLNQKLIDAVNIVSSGWGDIATDVAEAITHLLETPNSIDVDSFDKLEDAVELGFRIALGDEGFSLLHSLNLAPTTPQQGSEPSL